MYTLLISKQNYPLVLDYKKQFNYTVLKIK